MSEPDRDGIVVIIPARNAAATLGRQLAALDAQTDLDFRVVVADNGSTDDTLVVVTAWKPRFRSVEVLDASQHTGAANARNVAIERTSEPLILMCDADDRVHLGWVAALRAGLADADAVTGPLHVIQGGRVVEVLNATSVPKAMRWRHFLPTCNLGVRRTSVAAVGGFDPRFELGQEDVDFGWRLEASGARLQHCPDAVVDYHQRDSLAAFARQQYRWGRAYVTLYLKHRPDVPPAASWPASVRWFWEWAKLLRTGRRRFRSLGGPAFQVGRIVESVRQRTRTAL